MCVCTPVWRCGEGATSKRRLKRRRKHTFLFLLFFWRRPKKPSLVAFLLFCGGDQSKKCVVVAVVLTRTLFRWSFLSPSKSGMAPLWIPYLRALASSVWASNLSPGGLFVWGRVVSCAALLLDLESIFHIYWSHVDL